MSQTGRNTRSKTRREPESEPRPIVITNTKRRIRCNVCKELGHKEQMLCCNICRGWSHIRCVNVDPDDMLSVSEYRCQDCRNLTNISRVEQESIVQRKEDRNSTTTRHIVNASTVNQTTIESSTPHRSAVQSQSVESSIGSSKYKSARPSQGQQSESATSINIHRHVYANVDINQNSTSRLSLSSSMCAAAAAIELQRLEDEKVLILEQRRKKRQIQDKILDELINQQKEIEKQLEEDKQYLSKRSEQQVLLETDFSRGSSRLSSSEILKRTMDWVNEDNRMDKYGQNQPVSVRLPQNEDKIHNCSKDATKHDEQPKAQKAANEYRFPNWNPKIRPEVKQLFELPIFSEKPKCSDIRDPRFSENVIVNDGTANPSNPVLNYNTKLQNSEPQYLGASVFAGSGRLTREQLAARQSLPKDLPEFNGNPKKWVEFITTYEQTTSLCGYTNAENLVRLRNRLKGTAYRMVESCLLMPSTVPEAIETLAITFGKPEDVVDTYIYKIRQMPVIKPDSLPALIDYSLEVRNLCATLEAVKLNDYLNNSLLLRDIVEKLPANLKISWAIHRESLLKPNLAKFGEWISNIAKSLTKITPVYKSSFEVKPNNNNTPKNKNYVNIHTVDDTANSSSGKSSSFGKDIPVSNTVASSNYNSQIKCDNCKAENHKIQNCHKFKALDYTEKWNIVQNNRLCRKCLGNHHVSKCRSTEKCGVSGCQFKHNRLLHKPDSDKTDTKTVSDNQVHPANFHLSLIDTILYRVVPIVIHYRTQSKNTYALLDEGSSISIMDSEIAKELNLTGKKENLCLKWTADTVRMEKESEKMSFEISGQNNGNNKYLVTVRTVQKLDLPSQSIKMDFISKYDHFRDLPIETYNHVKPMMLIGLDHYRLIVPKEVIEGKEEDPIATRCRLGWSICGATNKSDRSTHNINCHACECSDDKLYDLVKEFFSLEYLGIRYSEPRMSVEIERSINILEDTTIRHGNQFETGLIWKYDKFNLPDNFSMALRRLDCLNKQMAKDANLYNEIKRQLDHYITSGYARKLTPKEISEKSSRQWYLPMFAVTYPKKPTKVRMVFDAAAKFEGYSLNSVLLSGPDQLTSLPDMLRRFREGLIGLGGDIREMFHRVPIRKQDQDSQRFIFGDVKNPDHYVMLVMTFGAKCSPASAQYVKNKNAEEFKDEFPEAVNSIVNNHYVDDLLDSVDSPSEAIQLGKDIRYIHSRANFEIRNWLSNSTEVLQALGETHSEKAKNIKLSSELTEERVLGMWWDPSKDVFTFSLKFVHVDADILSEKRKPSKREVLRILMCLFDPLGFLTHFLVFLKILLHDVWRDKIGWDEEIKDVHFEKWKRWLRLLPMVETVKIPRHYALGCKKSGTSVQLHVFVDASQDAYATVAYFRFKTEYGVEIALVGAKSKVAPLKPMSIPRLELQAGLIGARFSTNLNQAHTITIEKTFYWTDSSTVLSWLHSDLRNYSRFVGFRVAEILELTNVQEWNWIPSKLNVADEATKWKKNPEFESSSRWFSGPEFLKQSEDQWPEQSNIETTSEELRPQLLLHSHIVTRIPFRFNAGTFSSYLRLRRALALALRYCFNLIAKVRVQKLIKGPITQSEYTRAENTLIQKAQFETYTSDIPILKHNIHLPINEQMSVEPSSPLYKQSPYLDENHIIRMRGRIDAAKNIPEMTKRPILLPRYHAVTSLLVDHYHRRYHHHNHETVVNEIRQKFVIPRLRVVLRRVINDCQECKNNRAVPQVPEMADLPDSRLQSYTRPFSFVGIDYFGPVFVTEKRSTVKRWVLLATCLTVRAIHLEVTHSMTTDSFIMSFENFKNIRGRPLEVRSDNGSNFKGADNELRKLVSELDWNKIRDNFIDPTDTEIKWIFNPPLSPHMGGVWERLVESVKKTLYSIMPDRHPNDEVLKNLITGVANIVNSRPLTYMPIESSSSEALTPNHFLLGSSNGSKPLGEFSEDVLMLRKNWQKSQYLQDLFWKRWVAEYLPTLTRRTRWFENVKRIEVGDIVILVDDSSPRNCWRKGVVLAIKSDRIGRVRSVSVQTSTTKIGKDGKIQTSYKIYDRPVAKLAVLDVLPQEVSCPMDISLGGSVKDNPGTAK